MTGFAIGRPETLSEVKAGRQECLPHLHNGFVIVVTLSRVLLALAGAPLVGARPPATSIVARPVIPGEVEDR